MDAVVKLKCGDREGLTRLYNNQLHIPTIEGMFGLSSVDVEGIAEPTHDRGFTFMTYQSGSTLQISGIPAAGLFHPLGLLCCIVATVLLLAAVGRLESSNESHSGFSRSTLPCYPPTQPLFLQAYQLA